MSRRAGRADEAAPPEHVNGVLGSVDVRTPAAWVFTGWVVGQTQIGPVTSATIFAEVNDGTTVRQELSGAAPAIDWYKTQLSTRNFTDHAVGGCVSC